MELNTIKKVEYWLGQLADELEERLSKDKTNVILLVLSYVLREFHFFPKESPNC
jgi:hypothetical protein